MSLALPTALGLLAGLHAALYGAYKDSPHESFKVRRFVRELAFGTLAGAGIAAWTYWRGLPLETPFVIYLSCFALSRIATEFWKLFLRVEPQDDYRIPTQIHWVKGVVRNPLLRFLLGLGFLAAIYGIYALWHVWPSWWPATLRGFATGISIGIAEAMAGGYKDGAIEGFSWRKFAKSPTFGALGGIIAAGHTTDPAFLLLAAIGSMRMFLELLFKMLVHDYTPGKFRALVGPFPEWYRHRRHFVTPYAVTWAIYVLLCSHPDW